MCSAKSLVSMEKTTPEIGEITINTDWLDLFDAEDVQFIILDPHEDGDLVKAIQSQHRWAVDYKDEQVVIFARAG